MQEQKCVSFQGYVFCIEDCRKKHLDRVNGELIQCSRCSKFCLKGSTVSRNSLFFCSEGCAKQGMKKESLLVETVFR